MDASIDDIGNETNIALDSGSESFGYNDDIDEDFGFDKFGGQQSVESLGFGTTNEDNIKFG